MSKSWNASVHYCFGSSWDRADSDVRRMAVRHPRAIVGYRYIPGVRKFQVIFQVIKQ